MNYSLTELLIYLSQMLKTKKNTKSIDRWTMIIGLCVPFVTLPQLYTAITASSIVGISLLTWSFYSLQAGIFAIFGFSHKSKPLIYTYVPLFVVQFCIVITILIREYF